MALPHLYSHQDSSLLSGIEPLPLSPPTSPYQNRSRSLSLPSPAFSPSGSGLRHSAFSTTQLHASLRRSKELETEDRETLSHTDGEKERMQNPDPTMASNVDDLAEEMSQKLQEGVEASSIKGVSYISQMESLRYYLQNMMSLSSTGTSHSRNARPLSPTVSLSGLEGLFPHYASLYNVGPAVPDLQLSKDLDRETARRKHLERHVQNLQNEMLELQQRLTVTLTADRRKDTMIQHLDQNLALVVGGWKQQEQKREEMMHQLTKEKEESDQARVRDGEALAQVQKELFEVRDSLEEEKQRLAMAQNELQKLAEEKTAMVSQFLTEQEKERREVMQKNTSAGESEEQMQELQTEWLEERRENCGAASFLQESQKSRQLQQALASLQGEVTRLERDLQVAHSERDTLEMDLNLEKARGESEKVRLESEHKVHLEETIAERLSAVHKETAQHLSAVREQHRGQLLDLTSQHEAELSAHLSQFNAALQERERRHREVIMEYDRKLSHSEDKAQELSLSLRRLESERADMLAQLQEVMRSHWSQALRVLTSKSSETFNSEKSREVSFQPVQLMVPGEQFAEDTETTEVKSQDIGHGNSLKECCNLLTPSATSHLISDQLKNSLNPIAENRNVTNSTNQPFGDQNNHQFVFNQFAENLNPRLLVSNPHLESGGHNLIDSSQEKNQDLRPLTLLINPDSHKLISRDSSHFINQYVSKPVGTGDLGQSLIGGGSLTSSQRLTDTGHNNNRLSDNHNSLSHQSLLGNSVFSGEPLMAVEKNNGDIGKNPPKQFLVGSYDIKLFGDLEERKGVDHSTYYDGSQMPNVPAVPVLKRITSQHDGEAPTPGLQSSQPVLDHGPVLQGSYRVPGQNTGKYHSRLSEKNYQPSQGEAEESFYPLQMEELSHSFSSHMGFYALEPHQDQSSVGKVSDHSHLLSTRPTTDHSQYLQGSSSQISNCSADFSKEQVKTSKNPESRFPEAVKKEVLPSHRLAVLSKGPKKTSVRGGRSGIWR
ncbi:hypothetical protein GDO86_007034 [Hymenochirus boettgeri]|uniref:Centrobin n=1 Tax=Hymenochirus boettgeri TaxID=247094 RepID=A0A8T2JCZ0_9PIPI|nr:hypothetical protein GDO86_007034 [Hymenochirus boettgeri]